MEVSVHVGIGERGHELGVLLRIEAHLFAALGGPCLIELLLVELLLHLRLQLLEAVQLFAAACGFFCRGCGLFAFALFFCFNHVDTSDKLLVDLSD